MNLDKYTKSELIEAIGMLTGGSYAEFERCLYFIDEKRIKELFDEAYRLNNVAVEARQQYIDMLKPYNGKKFSEIPLEVIAKSQKYINKARDADEKWSKIMKKTERTNNHDRT